MKNLTTIGIDIAKNFMQVHGIDSKGKVLLKKRVGRESFVNFMANLPKCLVGMEACASSNYWAEKLIAEGFTVKLMSPSKVKKYVENHKNDAKDAQACAVAVERQDMTFVPIKTKVQRDIQSQHRARSYYVKQRTGLMNMTRGFLLEIGIAVRKGQAALVEEMKKLFEETNSRLTMNDKEFFKELFNDLIAVDKKVTEYTKRLEALAKEDELCKKIRTIPGIGPITASAMIAKIGNSSEFRKGRELSAYLGLVPKQHSSGEKQFLGRISKHGDRYVRQLLIHGARSSIKAALKKDKKTGFFEKHDKHSEWIRKLMERMNWNKASVAVANKNARMIVALLKNQTSFQPELAH